jgi:hypothetical protein
MKLENQCCNLEQAKELRELGVKQDSLFYHFPDPNTEYVKNRYKLKDYDVLYGNHHFPKDVKNLRASALAGDLKNTFSAFTVAELSVMLGDNFPSWSFKHKGKTKWIATIQIKKEKRDKKTVLTEPAFDRYEETQAQALATLLIATIKVKYIKVSAINKRLK